VQFKHILHGQCVGAVQSMVGKNKYGYSL